MVISARVHYACLAMLELTMRADDSAPVAVREITDRHQIPGPFLAQILRPLRVAGWVQSVRGSQGGYRLTVDPGQITLLDIAEAMACQAAHNHLTDNPTGSATALQQVWDDADEASRAVLSSMRLSDLAQRCREGEATMFYI
ncbi:RrF2 family transcriptional regulator [Novipirellula artificiosorum]|uniref:HTH-type transcriptional regulator CymR n=1 Tax=Novipirellula artificiosorum TaxID=2528016 RepID=A0A5C6DN72_9BACT|nr:Rrf2 family transcriptional regulator [Novipirellula artificiosorum]TWU37307.1 HTH-type transcriptional regulator CymR [Novipirellula artificiosorum]